jgi:hypothetical protein
MLAAVEPSLAIGLEPDPAFAALCRGRYPDITLIAEEISRADPRQSCSYAIACHLLEQEDECLLTVGQIGKWLLPRSRIIFTFLNPLWAPLVKLFVLLGLRPKDRRFNYLTAKDVATLCVLAGYDVVEDGYRVFCPLPIPLIAPLINLVFARVPIIRNFGLIGFVIARTPADHRQLEPSVTVIIPCHNEEENIASCITRTPRMGSQTEILVVDDGSTDKTAEIVRRLTEQNPHLRLVSYHPRQGKANAVKTGFENATGDIVIILDADMTVPPEELANFHQAMAHDRAEFVNGTRMVYPKEVGAFTLWRLIGNKLFGILFSILIGQRCTDTLCGTKALYREDVGKMELTGKGWGDFDLLFGVAARKLKMIELPVHYRERKAGTSKMRFFRDGWELAVLCTKTALRLP